MMSATAECRATFAVKQIAVPPLKSCVYALLLSASQKAGCMRRSVLVLTAPGKLDMMNDAKQDRVEGEPNGNMLVQMQHLPEYQRMTLKQSLLNDIASM